ncbi:MAG: hypothetical protein HKM93_09020 [Desulfobacteraceae bacterium]|nr:hypothetical protein [Desulfobacteraceae bacterium]
MHIFKPYEARTLQYIDQVNSEGWRIKVYGISAKSLPLPDELVSGGTNLVISHLPKPALTGHRYGVGFLIIHQGTMRNWFLLDWWENEDILHHLLFSSPLENPGSIKAEPDISLIACVHEIRVINFESEAWIKTVLCDNSESSFERYLKLRLNCRD